MKFLTLVGVISCLITDIESARILTVFHLPSYSHQQVGHKLVEALASAGHEVTFLTAITPKKQIKNLKNIEVEYKLDDEGSPNMFEETNLSSVRKAVSLDLFGVFVADYFLNHTTVQTFLNSNEAYDVVIIEQFINEAFKGFCYRFNAPCIMVSAVGTSRWTNPQMGNPGSPSYVPDLLLSLSPNMNFWERSYNSILYTAAELFSHLYTFRKQNEMLQNYFPGAPHFYDLYYNSSLMLLNSHVSTNAPVPLVPNMIDVGGMHVSRPKPLPKELQDYLDGAKDGAIFFSMGSNLKSKDLPKEKRDEILKALSSLKQRVLWKWEDETLPGQPPNVKLGKWLPQPDILAHPNIKLFITHGGLLSTIETIYHGVPIVGLPIYGDQEMNVANAEISGYGKGVPYSELNEQTFREAIEEVLNNPKYRENAKQRSKIMHDQPMKPIDRAVFWVEYVVRHRGAPHLRTAALHLTWYQYLLLDVVAFTVVVVFSASFLSYTLIKVIFCKKSYKNTERYKKNN